MYKVVLKHISETKITIIVNVIGTDLSKTYHLKKQAIHSSADITDDITITIADCTGRSVRFGYACPDEMQVDREEIYKLKMEGTIFVFGSNLSGIHGAGAALEANLKHGAELGVGEGPTGNSYAIPTKDLKIKTLPLDDIEDSVEQFIDYAEDNWETTFFVTRIGCGLAGYKEKEIAPFFIDAPNNCILPYGW